MFGPAERLTALFDRGSLQLSHPAGPERPLVLSATGLVHGRRVAAYAQDGSIAGGAVGEAEARAILAVLRDASATATPVVAFVSSAGARIQDGVGSLAGLAEIFTENVRMLGRVPQISVVTGPTAGGGAYSTALTDFTVMTGAAAMFLTGPGIVARACGENLPASGLGGAGVHARNGVSHLVAADDAEAIALVRRLIRHVAPAGHRRRDGILASAGGADPGRHLPARRQAFYDARHVARDIVDDGDLLELWPDWARNVVTAFAELGGTPIGVLANQPKWLGGAIDTHASDKAARFVDLCDRFGIPLVVLVDTPGFLPGSRQEHAGIIHRGARLVEAFARATVPRATVIVRKAFGGAYIAMNAKHLGATLTLAWPGAEIGIMDPHYATQLVHRRALAATDDAERLHQALAARYAQEHCGAEAACVRGFVDRVIAPAQTRAVLLAELGAAPPAAPLRAAAVAG